MNGQARFFIPAETARRLNVSTKALRLYERLSLVEPLRTRTGWRTYGPSQMADFPRGILHQEDHHGDRAWVGFSVDPATFKGPLKVPPEALAG
jgi:hypothetical protein